MASAMARRDATVESFGLARVGRLRRGIEAVLAGASYA